MPIPASRRSASGPSFANVALAGDFTVQTVPGYVESDELLLESRRPPAGVDDAAFKNAMRRLATGVVMVTTRVGGRPWGLTISACCSLSLDPPTLLVSLGSSTVSCKEILQTGSFGVSILGREHRELAERGAAVGVAKFVDEFCERDGCDPLDSPIISGALYHLDCSVTEEHEIGDHHLIVGLVRGAAPGASGGEPEPLLHFDRRFWELGAQLG